jgi:mannitol/fructose-specific phosphotransferase system IIA component (Ntr-type)
MAVVLSDLLQEEQVTLELAAQTRDDALREIIATMHGAAKVTDARKFLDEVLEREATHSTFVGKGIALPHARTDLVAEIILGSGRSHEGVAFGDAGERAHLIFVIAVPKRRVNDYLVCVGGLARVTNEEKTREALMSATTAAEFDEIIRAASLLLE